MKKYDILVIGSGSGLDIVSKALQQNLKVALVDKGPLGGTCLNLGCIPSKMLIYPADRVQEIRQAEKLGVKGSVEKIDFKKIMKRMHKVVREGRQHIRKGIESSKGLDFYEGEGRFVNEETIEVNNKKIQSKKIVIAAGSRPLIPPIDGLDKVDYLTNESVLKLKKPPKSIVIIGGGYIAAEYGHFLESMGAKVTILQRADRIVNHEDEEISLALQKELSKRIKIHTGIEAAGIKKSSGSIRVVAKARGNGKKKEFIAERVMIATGRKSNADLLGVEKAGIKTDNRGFIKVNNYFETNKKNIWAFGDIIGRQMFKHVANREARIVANNIFSKDKKKMDYSAVPHAIFSYPQAAGVGMTEEEAKKSNKDFKIGRASYSDAAKGEAMAEKAGFAKAIVGNNNQILGFHIIGPYAPILIQEVTDAMATGQGMKAIAKGMHIHPALPELILSALANRK